MTPRGPRAPGRLRAGHAGRVVRFAALVAALAAPLAAQRQFEPLEKRHLPPAVTSAIACAVADVDADGDVDVVLGGAATRLYRNDGSGTFTDVSATRLPVDLDQTSALAFGDVDGDGDLDLVLGTISGSSPRSPRLYLNDGTGTFSDGGARLAIAPSFAQSLALGDLDGDGDLDLVVANSGFHQLCLNDGTGTFTSVTGRLPLQLLDTRAVVLADVDADGDLDVVLGNATTPGSPLPRQNRIYVNDGTGTFSDGTALRMPVDDDNTRSLDLADVDGDGDLDLLLGNTDPLGSIARNRLYLNDGSGTFLDATADRLPMVFDSTTAARFGDVDLDGDLDIVTAGLWEQNRVLLNDGTATFVESTARWMPPDRDPTEALQVADLDGDGDLDLVAANGDAFAASQSRIYLNLGAQRFANANEPRMVADVDNTFAMLAVDVDGDGDRDLVLGNTAGIDRRGFGVNQLLLNDGGGRFDDVTSLRMPLFEHRTSSMAAGDVDGDGDLDLAVGNVGLLYNDGQNRLYLNDGAGRFTDVTIRAMPVDGEGTTSVAFADADGDGDLDLFFGNNPVAAGSSYQNRLSLNIGRGRFVDATFRLPVDIDRTNALAVGDVDGDGDVDLVTGNWLQQSRLLLNDGSGTFTDATGRRMPTAVMGTHALGLVDVDGDGDLDLLVGNGDAGGAQNRLYLNDGAGVFTDATAGRLPTRNDVTRALVVGDVDEDGDPDCIFVNSWERHRLLLNDGNGTFTDVTDARLPDEVGQAESAALADLDGDGDLDLAVGRGGQYGGGDNRVYLNLLRQLDAPLLLRSGHDYRLDVYARYGVARTVDTAFTWFSTTAARIPLPPIGTIGLDPGTIVALPPVVVPPGDVGSLTVPVPDVPGFLGIRFHLQALLMQWPAQQRLTNVATDVMIR